MHAMGWTLRSPPVGWPAGVGVYWTTGTRGTLTSKGEPKNYGSYAAATHISPLATRTHVWYIIRVLYGRDQVRSVSGPPSHTGAYLQATVFPPRQATSISHHAAAGWLARARTAATPAGIDIDELRLRLRARRAGVAVSGPGGAEGNIR
jgi:hypothetical protein